MLCLLYSRFYRCYVYFILDSWLLYWFAEHQSFFGIDDNLGPVAISFKREKCDERESPTGRAEGISGPCYMYRIIVRTSEVSKGNKVVQLTLKVLVTTIDAQWEGMGDVGSARYEPALLPPCPTRRVLSYSN